MTSGERAKRAIDACAADNCHECGEPNHGCPNGLCPDCESAEHDAAYAAELAEDEEGVK